MDIGFIGWLKRAKFDQQFFSRAVEEQTQIAHMFFSFLNKVKIVL